MHVPIRESSFSLPSVHLIAHLERTGGSPTHRRKETLVFSLFLILINLLVYFAVTAPITLLCLAWAESCFTIKRKYSDLRGGTQANVCAWMLTWMYVNMDVCFQIGPHSSVLWSCRKSSRSWHLPHLTPLTMMKHHQGSLPPSIRLSVHPFVHPSIYLDGCRGRGVCISNTGVASHGRGNSYKY